MKSFIKHTPTNRWRLWQQHVSSMQSRVSFTFTFMGLGLLPCPLPSSQERLAPSSEIKLLKCQVCHILLFLCFLQLNPLSICTWFLKISISSSKIKFKNQVQVQESSSKINFVKYRFQKSELNFWNQF